MDPGDAEFIDLFMNTARECGIDMNVNEEMIAEQPVAETSGQKDSEDEIQVIADESKEQNELERKRNRIEAMKECLGLIPNKKSEAQSNVEDGLKPVKYPKLEELLSSSTKNADSKDNEFNFTKIRLEDLLISPAKCGSSSASKTGTVRAAKPLNLLKPSEPNSEIDEIEVIESTNSPAPPDPQPAAFIRLETDEVLCEESSWPKMTRRLANFRNNSHVLAEIDLKQDDSDDECQAILNMQKKSCTPVAHNISRDRKFGFSVLNNQRVVWIETSANSGYMYLYARCGQSFKCVCKTCEKNGRVSKLELTKFRTGLKPFYEVDDHLPECKAVFVVASVVSTPVPCNPMVVNSISQTPINVNLIPPKRISSISWKKNDIPEDCPFGMDKFLGKHSWTFGKFYDITVFQEIYLKTYKSNMARKLVCERLDGKFWKYTCDECKNGETLAVYLPNQKILLGYKYSEHVCNRKIEKKTFKSTTTTLPEVVSIPSAEIKKIEKKTYKLTATTSAESVPIPDPICAQVEKIEKKPFKPTTTSAELIPVPDDLWILPCDENNIAKHYFYIISPDTRYGTKFILEEKQNGDLVYICEKCQLNGKTIYATVNITAGNILIDAAKNHITDCFEIDLKKALKIETGILTNY